MNKVSNEKFLISFCSTCKGRKHHLEKTLKKNLDVVSKYDDIELVLLDYNSKDNLYEWIKNNFLQDIKKGFFSYYKTNEPELFFMSHAKNISHKKAQGIFVCNLDGDNFLTDEFVRYLRNVIKNYGTYFVLHSTQGVYGRIALSKNNFLKIGGYDEDMKYGWGREDDDLSFRAERLGLKGIDIPAHFKSDIEHSDFERVSNSVIQNRNLSESLHEGILKKNAINKIITVNKNREWGMAVVEKNFGLSDKESDLQRSEESVHFSNISQMILKNRIQHLKKFYIEKYIPHAINIGYDRAKKLVFGGTHPQTKLISGIQLEDTIILVSCVDEQYIQHFGTMLASIIDNKKSTTQIDYYVINDGISKESKLRIESIANGSGVKICYTSIDSSRFKNFHTSKWIKSVALYYRLAIGELLPQSINRALYLDVDMIICKDLTVLWAQSLHGKTIGGINEPYVLQVNKDYYSSFTIANYINSGVMLINLKRWREKDYGNQAIQLARENDYPLWDQDAINIAAKDDIHLLPLYFNAFPAVFIEVFSDVTKSFFFAEEIRMALKSPTIIHFSGDEKPWQRPNKFWHPRRSLYWKYIKKTPWKDSPQPTIPFKLFKKYVIERYLPKKIQILYSVFKRKLLNLL